MDLSLRSGSFDPSVANGMISMVGMISCGTIPTASGRFLHSDDIAVFVGRDDSIWQHWPCSP